MRGGDDGPSWHGHGAMPPMPPHPPMMMFMSTNSDEFDRNGDGALSAEEFRNQQLRQFDAQDGNGDGRIRAAERLEAPVPPEPPTPPTPPRRR
ncbi:hypothetical protein U91I_01705 [alpha proteobacterium U9-1i]|nr:hypothetical protein U91I_01705 [alpha proteobacterium U9-1i]